MKYLALQAYMVYENSHSAAKIDIISHDGASAQYQKNVITCLVSISKSSELFLMIWHFASHHTFHSSYNLSWRKEFCLPKRCEKLVKAFIMKFDDIQDAPEQEAAVEPAAVLKRM
nr:unnamed protein product [Callosobruchus chinensis]